MSSIFDSLKKIKSGSPRQTHATWIDSYSEEKKSRRLAVLGFSFIFIILASASWNFYKRYETAKLVKDLTKPSSSPTQKRDQAVALLKNGLYDEALKALEEIRAEHAADADLLTNIGYCYKMKHDPKKAESLYLEALKLESNSITALNNLGLLLLEQGNFKKSFTYLEKAAKLSAGKNPTPFFNLAVYFEKTNNWQKASDTYQQYVDQIPPTDKNAEPIRQRIRMLNSIAVYAKNGGSP